MKAGQKLSNRNGVQVVLFPLVNMRITQGANDTYSHTNTLALDLSTVGVWDIAYAPVDCKVINKTKRYNTIVFESLKPVLCADGQIVIIQWKMLHDNYIEDIVVGQQFEQGQKIYDEGGANVDGTPRVYGSHIHLVALRNGKEERAENIFYVNDTNILDDEGYMWKVFVEPFLVGDKVKIIGDYYYTGQKVPWWVKLRTYTIQSIRVNRALMREIQSWVYLKDIKRV